MLNYFFGFDDNQAAVIAHFNKLAEDKLSLRHQLATQTSLTQRLQTALDEQRAFAQSLQEQLNNVNAAHLEKERELRDLQQRLQEASIAGKELQRQVEEKSTDYEILHSAYVKRGEDVVVLQRQLDEKSADFAGFCVKFEEVIAGRDRVVSLLNERLQHAEAEQKLELSRKDSMILALRDEVLDLRGNFRVFARIRPTSEAAAIVMQDDQELVVNSVVERYDGPRQNQVAYTFDRVIGPRASNEDVYLEMESLARSVSKGHAVTVFAYGATNSGKTHTMFGGENYQSRGIAPRVLETVFEMSKAEEGMSVSVELTCLEIYLEKVFDLLTGKECDCSGLNAHRRSISSADEFALLQTIKKRRTSATSINKESSRSHLILQVFVETKKGRRITSGVINLVDLAGSESSNVERDAEQKAEGSNIRTSLLSLQKVLKNLKGKTPSGTMESHEIAKRSTPSVLCRDSKLTYLLKDSLSHGKVLMFVNLSPEESSLTETKNSLVFGEFVQTIHIGQSKASVSFDVRQ